MRYFHKFPEKIRKSGFHTWGNKILIDAKSKKSTQLPYVILFLK